ncbi:MAG: excinuclease ABC subunit UvrA [Puniceicoccaceae bacterium]|nr:MAG: excinuclease ABC subunit UvrA [Puniceicoccaceae bacterium]
MNPPDTIHIKGAREHNLRNLEVRLPRNRLTVVTGVSGSGKSSLAFDTLYAEGYRKYIESLSTRARQFLEQVPRPEVDYIHGLSPVLAIEQRTGAGSPRSTVATVTEIADYARLLWLLLGEQHCPLDGAPVRQQTLEDALERLLEQPPGSRAVLLAPWIEAKPAVLRDEIAHLRQRGFQRIRLAGEIRELDEPNLIPAGRDPLTVDLVVDRVVLGRDQRSRLADSLELAFREGRDRAIALVEAKQGGPWKEIPLSRNLSCTQCGTVYEPLTPRHFSPNTAEGACPECGGLGQVSRLAEELVVPDPSKSVKGGAFKALRIGGKNLIIRHNALLRQLAEQLPFDPECPWRELPEETRRQLLHGAGERLFSFRLRRGKGSGAEAEPFPGVLAILEQARRDSRSDGYKARLAAYMSGGPCTVCQGGRLHPRSAAVRVDGKTLPEFFSGDIDQARAFMRRRVEGEKGPAGLAEVVGGIRHRLEFLSRTGLGYLTLNREYGTLSGGEAQRVRLATQLGMGLSGVIYVLDEPSVGLHARDNRRLIATLEELRDLGNTVVVVEHDEDTIRAADHLIELGPGAGPEGGRLLFSGTPKQCLAQPPADSPTAAFLSGKARLHRDAPGRRPDDRRLEIRGAREHNLQDIDVRFPVGLLTCVTGVSGSGKSTLVNDILAQEAARRLNRAKAIPGRHSSIHGLDHFDKVVQVTQDPIGQSPRSNPATYTKFFDLLRDLFARCPLSRVRGYKASRFSFNVRGGRCERCQGDGVIRLDLLFMSDAYSECPACGGRRYNRETLEVRFAGRSIADVLEMSVSEARMLFRNLPKLAEKLDTLEAVGLGYLKLGQPANTLSGGEAQRIKLSLELSKRQQGRSLYLLDEPTTGLHWADIQKLLDLLFRLRDAGNTVILIEHHLDVIRLADWVVDLGPGGGRDGGAVVFAGRPEELAGVEASATGAALREMDAIRPRIAVKGQR